MMLSWKIRYLDRVDKQFKDRCLYLDTKTLDPLSRVAVELATEDIFRTGRQLLKFRHLFVEDGPHAVPEAPNDWANGGKGFCVPDYFEDEGGKQISQDEMVQILTGNPNARVLPAGAKQHDIDLMFAEPKPVPLAEISLSSDEIRLLGIFARDLQEMLDSAFMKDGPGRLSTGGYRPRLETAVTDEEIRSFVTIFRRLYMTSDRDPANFLKIVPIFVKALGDHPYSKWVEGAAKQYQDNLAAVPDLPLFVRSVTCTFRKKRLLDVFIYTQYAHQPTEERQRQFKECLAEVQEKRAVLTWMFFVELWKTSLEICNVGRIIVWWFKRYCNHQGISPDVLKSLREDHPGLGAAEKEEDKKERLFREKAEQLATELWKRAGCPSGGHSEFLETAREQLTRRLQG